MADKKPKVREEKRKCRRHQSDKWRWRCQGDEKTCIFCSGLEPITRPRG